MTPLVASPDRHEHVADVSIYRGPDGLYACAEYIAPSMPTGIDAKAMQFQVARLLVAAAAGTRAFARAIRTGT